MPPDDEKADQQTDVEIILKIGNTAVFGEAEHDPFIDGLKFEFPPEDYP